MPLPLQADDVDAADLRGIAVDEHEPGHVVIDPRLAADEAVGADRHEWWTPTPPEMVACDSTWTWPPSIVPLAIVIRSPSLQSWADVDAGHQVVVAADPGEAVFLLGRRGGS